MVASKSEASQKLLVSDKGSRPINASGRIPVMVRPWVSERAMKTLDVVEKFVEEECIPADPVIACLTGEGTEKRFSAHPQIIEDLKLRAKELGLWNMFLPKNHFKEGAGFSNLEYGLMAEMLGKSLVASEVRIFVSLGTLTLSNILRPGHQLRSARHGKHGSHRQVWHRRTKEEVAWKPARRQDSVGILNDRAGRCLQRRHQHWVDNAQGRQRLGSEWRGEIKIQHRSDRGADILVQKWWSSGAGDPRCAVYITMGKSDPDNKDPYQQQSVILVDADTPGITVKRMLSVFGYDDAPHGHGHIIFENVRVHESNMVLGAGRGFEIIQGRLGPGRIHHAMRSIGAVSRTGDITNCDLSNSISGRKSTRLFHCPCERPQEEAFRPLPQRARCDA